MQVWDTNSLAAVCNFGLPDRVFALDMSQVAAVHCLIAVGSAEPQASAYTLTQRCSHTFSRACQVIHYCRTKPLV